MLPYVKIDFANGALGRIAPSPDGVFGILTNAAPVVQGLQLLTNNTLTKFADATTTLGITEVNNAALYKLLKEFYDEAGDGTELWLRCFADTVSMTEMLDSTSATAVKALINAANGKLRGIFVHKYYSGDPPQKTGGLDSDVATARTAAQTIGTWAATTLKAPLFVAISGMSYSGTPGDLTDLTLETNNRVAVMIGDTLSGTGCAIGVLAGRLAKVPVQRNIGRVKDGAAVTSAAYLATTKVENADPALLHDKGSITFSQIIGRAGYFFTDDPLATLPTDDYNGIAVRRVIDKAYRIAYNTLIDELLDEITVNASGQVSVSYAKGIESKVENAIIGAMAANGELGNDPANQNDTGVQCLIDPAQNIVSTGKLIVGLRVKPHGYAKYIEVELGFETITQ